MCRHIENACADQRRSRYLLFDWGQQCHRAGARPVPTKDNGAADADYVKGDVFLKQGTVYTEPSAKVDFAVSEAGQAKEYFTDDRAVTDESDITHEWFVDQTQYVTIRPADITVYTGGNSYDGVTDENGQIVSGSGLHARAGYPLCVPGS